MSAPRPRPVTATIRKPPPTGSYRAKRNVTLLSDSSGSTESLLSCVNSEEITLDSQCSPRQQSYRSDVRTTRKSGSDRHGTDEESPSECLTSGKRSVTSVTLINDTKTNPTEDPPTEIGPWEQWMIRKEESLKKLTEQKTRLEKIRKDQERQQELERREKLAKAERVNEEWLKQKDEEKARMERRQQMGENRKKREKEKRNREIEEKACEKYQEWLEQKKKIVVLQHSLDIEQRKLKELELKDKREKSEAAFETWLIKASRKCKGVPHSYAKCDGTITGYYNSAASPSPSYYNPVPWQPVALPQSQPKPKVKAKTRRKIIKNAWTMDN